MLSLPPVYGRFPLEEVAFTAYYPADLSGNPSKGIYWLLRPLSDSLLGLSTYIGISTWLLWPAVYLFGSLLKIPAYLNAPLLHPEKAEGTSEKRWPLVIFSHGLGGGRTTYSQYCSHLAASGKVVLALEHRDGTGMACMPRSWEANWDDKAAWRSIVYLRETDVYWDDGDEPKDYPKPLRGEQLAFRHHEIYIMYEAFKRFLREDSELELEVIDRSTFDKASWRSLTSSGSSIIKHSEDVLFTAHSFGGATALSLLATKLGDNYAALPISKVIVLDPWLDPLPTPGPAPYAAGTSDSTLPPAAPSGPRLFVINSEVFTLWKDHYARLEEIMAVWEPQGRRIATIIGSQHISFSDFSLLPIFRKKYDLLIFDSIMRLSLAFLDDELDEVLKSEVPTTDMNIEIVGTKPDGKPKRKLAGNVGHRIKFSYDVPSETGKPYCDNYAVRQLSLPVFALFT
ncbi:Platelet-activating factor acetylhydrolase [Leucoagaricus sp. SymC.cos]|nr:Platelet-activating factor acetylhydrolase [Leucoagaricus sp. SymC.cos]